MGISWIYQEEDQWDDIISIPPTSPLPLLLLVPSWLSYSTKTSNKPLTVLMYLANV